ncbi:MAG: UDP-4-amino-4,6-dideoxy-N-acetyl-beta-L-altrosamine N-acetyltransferase [Campylobacterales bacterium]|nr:UDP-4-amino-4,6-dideoxy-N-acetyl-beta-L-altrosamine N-acetyltransferase [Campylobacterales bacterium]
MNLKNFTDLSTSERDLVRQWRNDERVRTYMYTTHEISAQEHEAFILRLRSEATKRYFLIFEDDTPIGVIDFTDIRAQSALIGLYANPTQHGVGAVLMQSIIDYALMQEWHTLRAEVLASNLRAQNLYARFGFELREKSRYREQEILIMERSL